MSQFPTTQPAKGSFPIRRARMEPPTVGPSVPASLDTETGEGAAAAGITRAGAGIAQWGMQALAKLKEASDAVETSTAMRKYDEARNEAVLARAKSPDAETDEAIDAAFRKKVEEIDEGISNQTVKGNFQKYHDRSKSQYMAKTGAISLKRDIRNLVADAEVNAQSSLGKGDVAGAIEQWQRIADIGQMSPAELKQRSENAPFLSQLAIATQGQELDPDAATERISGLTPVNKIQSDAQYTALVRTSRLSSLKNSGDAELADDELANANDLMTSGADLTDLKVVRGLMPHATEGRVYAVWQGAMEEMRTGFDSQSRELLGRGDVAGAKAIILLRAKKDPEYSDAEAAERIKDLKAESELLQAKLLVPTDMPLALKKARAVVPKTGPGVDLQRNTVSGILQVMAQNEDKLRTLRDDTEEALRREVAQGVPQTQDDVFTKLKYHTTKEKALIWNEISAKAKAITRNSEAITAVSAQLVTAKSVKAAWVYRLAEARAAAGTAQANYDDVIVADPATFGGKKEHEAEKKRLYKIMKDKWAEAEVPYVKIFGYESGADEKPLFAGQKKVIHDLEMEEERLKQIDKRLKGPPPKTMQPGRTTIDPKTKKRDILNKEGKWVPIK